MSPNTLIAYAAKAGSTAADGDGNNSPFTSALVKYLPTPGLDLRMAFGFVRDDVMKVTRNRQEPFIYGSLGGNDVALVPTAARDADRRSSPPPGTITSSPSQINVVAAWESFIKKYPTGFYSDLARAQRDKLIAAQDRRVRTGAACGREEGARRSQSRGRRTHAARSAGQGRRRCADRGRKGPRGGSRAKAAQAREAAERQKAPADAKAAEDARFAAARKAAEEARLAAEGRSRTATPPESRRGRPAGAEKKAAEEARVAEAARAKAAQAQAEANMKLAAVLPRPGLGQQAAEQALYRLPGHSAQIVSLSLGRRKDAVAAGGMRPEAAETLQGVPELPGDGGGSRRRVPDGLQQGRHRQRACRRQRGAAAQGRGQGNDRRRPLRGDARPISPPSSTPPATRAPAAASPSSRTCRRSARTAPS